jgi:hypothetical protein
MYKVKGMKSVCLWVSIGRVGAISPTFRLVEGGVKSDDKCECV